ncbi:hypothetical protein P4594_25275, partial [Priestia megaterium]|uniref:hypothetical protein n=1 Tax=Priestia megaterium TaxID=1404 RepID=UPI002E1B05C1|nr:hypothetical protein [Priestia megaterium]
ILSLVVLYLIFGNLGDAFVKMMKLRGEPTKTADAVASLSYVGTILLAFYGLITTAFFSYLVWKVSVGSFQVSKEIKSLEENRDKEIIREQALIVYYDLQRGFSYLRDLYVSTVLKKGSPKPKRLFFSNDWIKNVATLRNELSNEDLNKVYELYNNFFTLQALLESYLKEETEDKEFLKFIEELSKEVFAEFLPLQLMNRFDAVAAEDLIKIDTYIILQKIYLLTFTNSKIKTERKADGSYTILVNDVSFYTSKEGEENKWSGKGTLYTPNGYPKAMGHFANGIFMTGKVYGYFNSISECYKIEYQTTSQERKIISKEIRDLYRSEGQEFYYKGKLVDGEVKTGITTNFDSRNVNTWYRGSVINGLKDGEGIQYNENGTISLKAKYEKNAPVEGILYKDGKILFEGTFKDFRPWNGQTFNYDFSQERVKEFTGEIRDGKPYKGMGYLFKRNDQGQDLAYMDAQEEYWEQQVEEWEDRQEQWEWEQQDEHFYAYQNEQTREKYYDWEDYIKTDWNNGDFIEYEDIERNIVVYFNKSKKVTSN